MYDKLAHFIDLFLRSPFYRRVRAVLSEPEAQLAQKVTGFDAGLAPPQMLSGPPDADGLAPWVPINSPIDAGTVAGFERFLGVRLPPLFREYLCYKSLINMDLHEGTLPDIDPRKPLSWLEWCATHSGRSPYRENPWLVPLTYGPARISDLCLDTRRPNWAHDYPILIIHHNARSMVANPVDNYNQRQCFDSFEDYFEFLINWLTYKCENVPELYSDWLGRQGKSVPPAIYYQY
jgi:hypothetical protein